jgi:hypothetical protein
MLSHKKASSQEKGWLSLLYLVVSDNLTPWQRVAPSSVARVGHTAAMAFHESFWVVAGTAAPIIALANLVAIGDGWGLSESFSPHYVKPQTEDQWKLVRKGKRAAFWIYFIGLCNLLVQSLIVFAALTSLEDGKNQLPTALAVSIETVGILACLFSALITARWRAIAQQAQFATQQATQTTNNKPA